MHKKQKWEIIVIFKEGQSDIRMGLGKSETDFIEKHPFINCCINTKLEEITMYPTIIEKITKFSFLRKD